MAQARGGEGRDAKWWTRRGSRWRWKQVGLEGQRMNAGATERAAVGRRGQGRWHVEEGGYEACVGGGRERGAGQCVVGVRGFKRAARL